jgi:hypothetical protein
MIREATADAALDLFSLPARPRYGRLRQGETPVTGDDDGMPVTALLAEVARRQEIMRQMSALVTADTAVQRQLDMPSRGVRVSAAQWALVIRVNGPATPRDLAMELGHSVFGTTINVLRLMELNLLSAVGGPAHGRSSTYLRPRPPTFSRAGPSHKSRHYGSRPGVCPTTGITSTRSSSTATTSCTCSCAAPAARTSSP